VFLARRPGGMPCPSDSRGGVSGSALGVSLLTSLKAGRPSCRAASAFTALTSSSPVSGAVNVS
jgi:hypothetical protein